MTNMSFYLHSQLYVLSGRLETEWSFRALLLGNDMGSSENKYLLKSRQGFKKKYFTSFCVLSVVLCIFMEDKGIENKYFKK